MIRKLWMSLHPNPVPVPTTPVVHGGDPAPNYQWNTHTYSGDLYIKLEQWHKGNWMNRGRIVITAHEDYATAVPSAKKRLWTDEQERAETERKNNEWAEQNL